MTTTQEAVFVPGVWGPYYSAMVPGYWLGEGGQSAAGAAIDQLLSFHPAAAEAREQAKAAGVPLPVWLADRVLTQVASPSEAVTLAAGLHVVPEFLGNRAPLADPPRESADCRAGDGAGHLDNLDRARTLPGYAGLAMVCDRSLTPSAPAELE
ncbi:hypothetical protein LNQ03_02240 [Klebsiella pneumoniae subsp. pneumoniae]|nr:hypothetical protein [Klebsiella pneumoniae subsp. pneumoniae]